MSPNNVTFIFDSKPQFFDDDAKHRILVTLERIDRLDLEDDAGIYEFLREPLSEIPYMQRDAMALIFGQSLKNAWVRAASFMLAEKLVDLQNSILQNEFKEPMYCLGDALDQSLYKNLFNVFCITLKFGANPLNLLLGETCNELDRRDQFKDELEQWFDAMTFGQFRKFFLDLHPSGRQAAFSSAAVYGYPSAMIHMLNTGLIDIHDKCDGRLSTGEWHSMDDATFVYAVRNGNFFIADLLWDAGCRNLNDCIIEENRLDVQVREYVAHKTSHAE